MEHCKQRAKCALYWRSVEIIRKSIMRRCSAGLSIVKRRIWKWVINMEPFNRPHQGRLWPNYVFRATSQSTGLPPLQCWRCEISIINWWLDKDNIPFPRRTHRLWSRSFSTAIFIRPQLAEQTTPPAGPVALVACLAPCRESFLSFFLFFFLPPLPLWFLWCPCWKQKTSWPVLFPQLKKSWCWLKV